MIRIGIAGSAGKMGKALIEETIASPDLVLAAATVSPKSSLGTDVGTLVGLQSLDLYPVHDLKEVIQDIDVLIDFTTPQASMAHVALCVKHHKKMIIGTTGLSLKQKQALEEASKTIPIVFAPNMSVGLNVCLELIQTVAKKIGEEADLHISEAHHRHKKDSPSGTSLNMEAVLREVLNDKAIGHSSIRAGEIVGDHTVLFALPGESIEITHKAFNRNIFAKGALRCARWLKTRSAGLYTMRDVLAI